MIPNIYTPNMGVPRYIKQVLNDLQRDRLPHSGVFNTPLSTLDRSMRQKINRYTGLEHRLEQADLIDIYRTLHPTATKYTFFLAPHHTYSKIDRVIGSKSLFSICIAFHRFK